MDATATDDTTAINKIAIFKLCFMGGGSSHLSMSLILYHIVFPKSFMEKDLKIHVLLAALAVIDAVIVSMAVASLNYLKTQLRFYSEAQLLYIYIYIMIRVCLYSTSTLYSILIRIIYTIHTLGDG